MSQAFDFGRNWKDFSATKLDAHRLNDAAQSLQELLGEHNIADRTFLDIGCGSGLFSIAAAQCQAARIIGFDVNSTAVEVSRRNFGVLQNHLEGLAAPDFCIGDVLDRTFLAALGTFDIVYAWGVLHHTGAMWQAVRNAASLVEPENGMLVVAIYNSHWTSPAWRQIKRVYNLSPRVVRSLLNYFFAGLIYFGVLLSTRQNPLRKERGMDFWFDVIDWLGGYPYEYASVSDVISFVEPLGFRIERVTKPRAGTGCNEFIFVRSENVEDSERRTGR